MRVYRPKTATLDGITYEVNYHADKKHVRVYARTRRGLRKVDDLALVKRVVEAVTVPETEKRARDAAVAAAPDLGVVHP